MKAKSPPDIVAEPPSATIAASENASPLAIRRLLQPVVLNAPQVERKLSTLSPVERSAEVLRFSLAQLEFWLSPGGSLRACLRLGLKAWCLLSIFSVLIAPVVTHLLTQTLTWADLFAQIVQRVMLLPLGIGTFLLSVLGALFVLRLFLRR